MRTESDRQSDLRGSRSRRKEVEGPAKAGFVETKKAYNLEGERWNELA